MLHINSFYLI